MLTVPLACPTFAVSLVVHMCTHTFVIATALHLVRALQVRVLVELPEYSKKCVTEGCVAVVLSCAAAFSARSILPAAAEEPSPMDGLPYLVPLLCLLAPAQGAKKTLLLMPCLNVVSAPPVFLACGRPCTRVITSNW